MKLLSSIMHAILEERIAMDATRKDFELAHQVVYRKSLLDLMDTRYLSYADVEL